MKNRHIFLMVLVTFGFFCFCVGFLLGRNFSSGAVIVSRLPETTLATEPTSPPATQPPESIPSPSTQPPEGTTVPVETGLMNINTATLAQLDSLPGIGPVLAQRIIEYRDAHGPFTAVGQLTLVEGIGQKRLMEILELITVEQED